jgi:hypothetical protein
LNAAVVDNSQALPQRCAPKLRRRQRIGAVRRSTGSTISTPPARPSPTSDVYGAEAGNINGFPFTNNTLNLFR